jgi:peptidoglycan-N-acetylglucosamine deacetylase
VTSLTGLPGRTVLTYDDGPDPEATPGLLDALAGHDATATFFVLSEQVRAHPDLVRRAVREGHQVALHGLDHRRLPQLGSRAAVAWLRDSRALLEDVAQVRVTHFRPPHGTQSPRTWSLARALGLRVVLWDGTTWDWRPAEPAERVAKALESARAGSILLAHDGAHHDVGSPPPAHDVDKVALLHDLVHSYAERGLRFVSLEAALAAGARPVLEPSFSR